MEVILLERIEKLGQMGDVVNVKPGFARNFLLPLNKALRATPENREQFESKRSELEAANAERRSEAESVAQGIQGTSVVIVRQASDAGQLYGSVRPRDIANALNEQGADIDRTQVKLDTPIKAIGLHSVRIAVHPEVVVEITANVARSEDEAKLQAQGRSLIDEEAELGEDGEPARIEPGEEELAEGAAEFFDEAPPESDGAGEEDRPEEKGAAEEEGPKAP